MTENQMIVEVQGLRKYFPVYGGIFQRKIADVKAVDGVDFRIGSGQTLGLVGESGCGKSTVGRCILYLDKPSAGSVTIAGRDLSTVSASDLKVMRREFQIIFQDPYESLNSRHTVSQILEEPFVIHRISSKPERRKRVLELLDRVGLPRTSVKKFPHEFSGGQRQRIGIARAISLKPRFIVCDEAVSALDVSVQSQILNLLLDLQREMGLSYLFIAHDLSVVKHMSDRVAVMYLGRIVELASASDLYARSQHPYTQVLVNSIPMPDPKIRTKAVALQGEVPSPMNPPPGCHFHQRCPYAKDVCKTEAPPLKIWGEPANDHWVSCHFAGRLGR